MSACYFIVNQENVLKKRYKKCNGMFYIKFPYLRDVKKNIQLRDGMLD